MGEKIIFPCFVAVWFGLIQPGLAWSGLVWFGLGWSDPTWSGLVWFGLVWSDPTWSSLTSSIVSTRTMLETI